MMAESSKETEIIAIASGKGGTGKTIVAACLGYALTRIGHRVLMIDTDMGTDGLSHFLLGPEGKAQITDFLPNSTFAGVVRRFESEGELDFDPRPINRRDHDEIRYESNLVSGQNPYGDHIEEGLTAPLSRESFRGAVKALFATLEDESAFDYVLVDTRGGFSFETTDVCALAHSFILVTEADYTSFYQDRNLVRGINATAESLRGALRKKPLLRSIIVNKATEHTQRSRKFDPSLWERPFRIELTREFSTEGSPMLLESTHPVPMDLDVVTAYKTQKIPFLQVPDSDFSLALLTAFGRVLGVVTRRWPTERVEAWNRLVDEVAEANARRLRRESIRRSANRIAAIAVVAAALGLLIALVVLVFSNVSERQLDDLMSRLDGAGLSAEEKGENIGELLIGGRSAFNRLDLSGVILANLDLSGASFRSANLSGADLAGANLRDADLFRTDLTGANLSGAVLSGAQLTEARLDDAVLSQAKLDGASLDGAGLTNANLGEATLRDADLVRADLRGAILAKADLSGAVLFDAKVTTGQLLTAKLDEDTVLPNGSVGAANLIATPIVDVGSAVIIDEGITWVREGSFTNPSSANLTASVDFGDGSGVADLTLKPEGTFTVVHTYADDGVYTAVVEVGDETGHVGTDSVVVTVSSVMPGVNAGPDAVVSLGRPFFGAGFFTDPGADTWKASVNYGDGSGFQPLDVNPNRTFNLSHAYADAGFYTVAVSVVDDDGGTGTDFVLVTVLSPTPAPAVPTPTVALADLPEGVLTLNDLPLGFEQISPAEFELAKGTEFEGFTIDDSFVFASTEPFEFVYGFVTFIPARSEQIAFDVGISREEFLLDAFAAGFNEPGLTITDQKLTMLNEFGEASAGLQVLTDVEGLPFRSDIVILRRGAVAAFLYAMYLEGETPVVAIEEVASIVDAIIIDALEPTKAP